ncbi:MAG TPA: hypothetical protein VFG14_19970, partial [Chthoniobacteraceae bacterium]|nr:hypothetical protein [Chthoniobacteraceae bacterium]
MKGWRRSKVITVPFRVAEGTLHTNGFIKTEILQKETGSWLGTTSSSIRLNATYRYDIELRSKDWNIYIDDARRVAFVIAPPFRPQIPFTERTGMDGLRLGPVRQVGEPPSPAPGNVALPRKAGREQRLHRGRPRTGPPRSRGIRGRLAPHAMGLAGAFGALVKVYFADEPDIP